MNDAHRRYLNRETAVSAVVNAVLSFAVTWLVFGRGGTASVTDAATFARDFLPQAFVLSLMSTMVPGWLTRRRLAAGEVAPMPEARSVLPRSLPLRALLIAVGAAALGGGAAFGVTLAAWPGELTIGQVYLVKVAFGILLAVPVTRIGLRAALAAGR